ncbi:hypothetical protein ANAEL_05837 [Anaerolineales bacterium]|nr:hypothetical protein ANAEL_05837 [Anaerolineales bacterium]
MNGELAQIVSLVTHGNAYLNGENVDLSTNSTFQYVSAVKFARYKSNQDKQGVEIASNVSDWFSFLRSIKATRLWNIAFGWQRQDIPEHAADAFSGGVPRAIQADLPRGFELWYPQWKTSGNDKKPWLVEYRSLMFPNSHALPAQKLNGVKNQLRQAISQAQKFANRSDVNENNWCAWFTKSLEILDSSSPIAPFHPDMLPDKGFSLEARQVLASAVQSYVFGGMGSWNDLGFEKPETQKEYEKITRKLYEAVKFSITMSSNSYEPERAESSKPSTQQTGGFLPRLKSIFKPTKNPPN